MKNRTYIHIFMVLTMGLTGCSQAAKEEAAGTSGLRKPQQCWKP